MNFQEHFEKFEADLRKKMLDDETIIESLKEVCQNHQELNKWLLFVIYAKFLESYSK